MKLFRAVPMEADTSQVKVFDVVGPPTRRVPKNVPLQVDNIWEFFRPKTAPSRRHAAYASPTVELALANASARPGAAYEAWEVVLRPNSTVVICSVPDARVHSDIESVPKALRHFWENKANELQVAETGAWIEEQMASLAEPAMSEESLADYFSQNQELAAELHKVVSFWNDATILSIEELVQNELIAANAEIFFSSIPGYQLQRL